MRSTVIPVAKTCALLSTTTFQTRDNESPSNSAPGSSKHNTGSSPRRPAADSCAKINARLQILRCPRLSVSLALPPSRKISKSARCGPTNADLALISRFRLAAKASDNPFSPQPVRKAISSSTPNPSSAKKTETRALNHLRTFPSTHLQPLHIARLAAPTERGRVQIVYHP